MHNYIELTNIQDDPRFGEVAIMFNPSDTLTSVMRKTIISKSSQEHKDTCEKLRARFKINHPNLLHLIELDDQESTRTVSAYYEFPDTTFDIKGLSADEIVCMLHDITKAIAHLQKHNIAHGDVRPEYITFSESSNCYKLMDRLKTSSTSIQCQLNNIDEYRALYMSPTIFDKIRDERFDINFSEAKSDCFALGLIALGAFISPEILQEAYDFQQNKFNKVLLDMRISESLQAESSSTLKEILLFLTRTFLVYNDSDRMEPSRILDEILKVPEFASILKSRRLNLARGCMSPMNIVYDAPATSKTVYYNPLEFIDRDSSQIKRIMKAEIFGKDSNGNVIANIETPSTSKKKLVTSQKVDKSPIGGIGYNNVEIDITKFIISHPQNITNIKNALIENSKETKTAEILPNCPPSTLKETMKSNLVNNGQTISREIASSPSNPRQAIGAEQIGIRSGRLSIESKTPGQQLPCIGHPKNVNFQFQEDSKVSEFELRSLHMNKADVNSYHSPPFQTHQYAHSNFTNSPHNENQSYGNQFETPNNNLHIEKLPKDNKINMSHTSTSYANEQEGYSKSDDVKRSDLIKNSLLKRLSTNESNDDMGRYLKSLGISVEKETNEEALIDKLKKFQWNTNVSPDDLRYEEQGNQISNNIDPRSNSTQRRVKLSEYLRETTKSERDSAKTLKNLISDRPANPQRFNQEYANDHEDSKQVIGSKIPDSFKKDSSVVSLSKNRSTTDTSKIGNSSALMNFSGKQSILANNNLHQATPGFNSSTNFNDRHIDSQFAKMKPTLIDFHVSDTFQKTTTQHTDRADDSIQTNLLKFPGQKENVEALPMKPIQNGKTASSNNQRDVSSHSKTKGKNELKQDIGANLKKLSDTQYDDLPHAPPQVQDSQPNIGQSPSLPRKESTGVLSGNTNAVSNFAQKSNSIKSSLLNPLLVKIAPKFNNFVPPSNNLEPEQRDKVQPQYQPIPFSQLENDNLTSNKNLPSIPSTTQRGSKKVVLRRDSSFSNNFIDKAKILSPPNTSPKSGAINSNFKVANLDLQAQLNNHKLDIFSPGQTPVKQTGPKNLQESQTGGRKSNDKRSRLFIEIPPSPIDHDLNVNYLMSPPKEFDSHHRANYKDSKLITPDIRLKSLTPISNAECSTNDKNLDKTRTETFASKNQIPNSTATDPFSPPLQHDVNNHKEVKSSLEHSVLINSTSQPRHMVLNSQHKTPVPTLPTNNAQIRGQSNSISLNKIPLYNNPIYQGNQHFPNEYHVVQNQVLMHNQKPPLQPQNQRLVYPFQTQQPTLQKVGSLPMFMQPIFDPRSLQASPRNAPIVQHTFSNISTPRKNEAPFSFNHIYSPSPLVKTPIPMSKVQGNYPTGPQLPPQISNNNPVTRNATPGAPVPMNARPNPTMLIHNGKTNPIQIQHYANSKQVHNEYFLVPENTNQHNNQQIGRPGIPKQQILFHTNQTNTFHPRIELSIERKLPQPHDNVNTILPFNDQRTLMSKQHGSQPFLDRPQQSSNVQRVMPQLTQPPNPSQFERRYSGADLHAYPKTTWTNAINPQSSTNTKIPAMEFKAPQNTPFCFRNIQGPTTHYASERNIPSLVQPKHQPTTKP